jgi:hypothetical protein
VENGDYSARDKDAQITFYVLLWKRRGISQEQFDDYWRDVHGPVCARLPGQFQYWQWHVMPNHGGMFPTVNGVNSLSTDEEQFAGIAELTFRSAQDCQTWMNASAILMNDEHNIFSKAIGYVTQEGNSRTYVDRIAVGDPNGPQDVVRFHVMVRQAEGTDVTDFRTYMTDAFAAWIAKNRHVLKLRLHLLEPPDLSRPDAYGVAHSEPREMLYQAAFEIAFRNRLEMESFFASDDYAAAVKDQPRYVKQMSPFPERAPYTFVYDGKMTLAGRRGSRTAELISQLGAINQIQNDIARLIGISEPNN